MIRKARAIPAACMAALPAVTSAAATPNPVVTTYTHRHYEVDQKLIREFQARTSIEVRVLAGDADQLIQRIKAEEKTGPADLLITTDVARRWRARKEGILQAVRSPVLDRIPASLLPRPVGFATLATLIRERATQEFPISRHCRRCCSSPSPRRSCWRCRGGVPVDEREPAALSIEHVSFGWPGHPVLEGLSLTVRAGEVVALAGPSGCGRSTLLRLIAGLASLGAGRIVAGGRVLSGPGVHRDPGARGLGMVFQDAALFPHMSVGQNVLYGCRGSLAPEALRRRLWELVVLLGLLGTKRRYPHELSGGQQQRVAVARALAPRPALLLMDEALSLADRIAMIEDGRIAQEGPAAPRSALQPVANPCRSRTCPRAPAGLGSRRLRIA